MKKIFLLSICFCELVLAYSQACNVIPKFLINSSSQSFQEFYYGDPIIMDASPSTNEIYYFISIQIENTDWTVSGTEYMQWFSGPAPASINLNSFLINKSGKNFLPGTRYRIKLAVSGDCTEWNEKSMRVIIKCKTEPSFKINNSEALWSTFKNNQFSQFILDGNESKGEKNFYLSIGKVVPGTWEPYSSTIYSKWFVNQEVPDDLDLEYWYKKGGFSGFIAGNSYKVKIATLNDCEGWEEKSKYFTISCDVNASLNLIQENVSEENYYTFFPKDDLSNFLLRFNTTGSYGADRYRLESYKDGNLIHSRDYENIPNTIFINGLEINQWLNWKENQYEGSYDFKWTALKPGDCEEQDEVTLRINFTCYSKVRFNINGSNGSTTNAFLSPDNPIILDASQSLFAAKFKIVISQYYAGINVSSGWINDASDVDLKALMATNNKSFEVGETYKVHVYVSNSDIGGCSTGNSGKVTVKILEECTDLLVTINGMEDDYLAINHHQANYFLDINNKSNILEYTLQITDITEEKYFEITHEARYKASLTSLMFQHWGSGEILVEGKKYNIEGTITQTQGGCNSGEVFKKTIQVECEPMNGEILINGSNSDTYIIYPTEDIIVDGNSMTSDHKYTIEIQKIDNTGNPTGNTTKYTYDTPISTFNLKNLFEFKSGNRYKINISILKGDFCPEEKVFTKEIEVPCDFGYEPFSMYQFFGYYQYDKSHISLVYNIPNNPYLYKFYGVNEAWVDIEFFDFECTGYGHNCDNTANIISWYQNSSTDNYGGVYTESFRFEGSYDDIIVDIEPPKEAQSTKLCMSLKFYLKPDPSDNCGTEIIPLSHKLISLKKQTEDAWQYEYLIHERYSTDEFIAKNSSAKAADVLQVIKDNFVAYYPNPTEGIITMKIDENATYEITSLNGVPMSSGVLEEGISTLDLEDYPNGIYFLKINTASGSKTEKLVIQK